MRKIIKKPYIILSIFIIFFIIFSLIYILSNKKTKEEQQETQDNVSNSVPANTDETNNVTDENTLNVVETPNLLSEANAVNQIQKSTTEKNEGISKNANSKTKEDTQKNKVKQTEEKQISQIDTPKSQIPSTNTKPKEENNSTNITTQKPIETITKITDKQLKNETASYLQDIKSVKPGLKYENQKRGYVFWPYRKSEIDIGVGSVTFGTIYYYVEIFVEGNQEKFRYYLDWAGI